MRDDKSIIYREMSEVNTFLYKMLIIQGMNEQVDSLVCKYIDHRNRSTTKCANQALPQKFHTDMDESVETEIICFSSGLHLTLVTGPE